jgi:competence protein ComEC
VSIDPDTRVYVLHPFSRGETPRNLNNTSLVLKVLHGRVSLLLTGDAENEVEEQLLDSYGPFVQSILLKAGHHGSITSSGEQFLHAVRPRIAAISVGRGNKFGHPSPEVLRRFRGMEVDARRTDLEGALVWTSDGASLSQVDWRK